MFAVTGPILLASIGGGMWLETRMFRNPAQGGQRVDPSLELRAARPPTDDLCLISTTEIDERQANLWPVGLAEFSGCVADDHLAWLRPSASPEDRDRERRWASALHEPRDLVPVDLVCDCLGCHPGQAKAGQSAHAPGVYSARFRIDVLV
jgi:hypothetical protein